MNIILARLRSEAANFGRKNIKYYIQSCQSLQLRCEILGKIYSLFHPSVYLMYEINLICCIRKI